MHIRRFLVKLKVYKIPVLRIYLYSHLPSLCTHICTPTSMQNPVTHTHTHTTYSSSMHYDSNNRMSRSIFACAHNRTCRPRCRCSLDLLPTDVNAARNTESLTVVYSFKTKHSASQRPCSCSPLIDLFPPCVLLFVSTDDGLQNGPGQHRNSQGKL